SHPHAPKKVDYDNGVETILRYDANGNLVVIESNSDLIVQGVRRLIWDEQNRLLIVNDNEGHSISHYVYDHTGERTFKSVENVSLLNVGGQNIYTIEDMQDYLLYPSGNIVIDPNKAEYTKHYYSNGKRLASRLNSLKDQFQIQQGFSANQEDTVIPNQYTTFNINNTEENYCQEQIDSILAIYAGPTWSECRDFINSIIATNPNPCDVIEIINLYHCEENGTGPVPDPDPENPVYTPDEIEQFDCYVRLIELLNELSPLLDTQEQKCYYDVISYVQANLVLSPVSNACEVLAYIIANFDCIPKDDGFLDVPEPAPPVEDDFDAPAPQDGKEEEEFDESQRKPIWWYHSDHLGSSSYLTDNFGRPTHYYDQLPFGESMVEHNQRSEERRVGKECRSRYA